MKNVQAVADKAAISLSAVCAIHCLAVPLALIFLPQLSGSFFADEAFHKWMVIVVLPISIYALTLGCKQHKNYALLSLGGAGLAILVGTVIAGHEVLGEGWEKTLTVLATCLIALGHVWNYRLCQRQDNCKCSSEAAL